MLGVLRGPPVRGESSPEKDWRRPANIWGDKRKQGLGLCVEALLRTASNRICESGDPRCGALVSWPTSRCSWALSGRGRHLQALSSPTTGQNGIRNWRMGTEASGTREMEDFSSKTPRGNSAQRQTEGHCRSLILYFRQ